MKHIGIWIDKEKAHVILIKEDSEDMTTIVSEIENFHIHGGSGTQFKGGPQDVVQDSKYLEREKHQFKGYFKKIISLINDADRIVIYGPAETGEKFNKELTTNYKDISKKVKDVFKADSMTDNQTKALIRSYFKKDQQRIH
jgi:stalled ribosome rescue protein Dom34